MPTPVWDPQQYLRFADERTRPLHELLARVPELPAAPVLLDIGCGPGNSTAELRRRWPQAAITGIDNSAEMLATARGERGEPSAAYLLADAAQYDPAPARPDLIASNATLQWVDGHLDLLPRWAVALRPGGVLAFQVPGNFEAPSHLLLGELRRGPRWRDRLGTEATRAGVHRPEVYLDALLAAGCTGDVWETTYSTLLTGPDPVLEWTKGTALRPVLARLTDPGERAEFLAEYGALLREAYPAGPHGTVFPFRRIFAVGVKR
ncbi:methyltransferase domain-containing protein [Kitasatospora sp. NBC_01287]|uniref:methyltransferase domain-containing protein n=1 Tax=Kitasatospora sp. NBC_01287 TaxID=2903573 RepID=UPI002259739D|nr:methyltransferase domain-containing protein [Kitasatospora sp. NBC_01287]MCX4749987.1 methyltransferase domain-containing protein [Kitasatospora sp. NBC_01287]